MIPIDWKAALHYAALVKLAEDILPTQNDDILAQQLTGFGLTYQTTIHGNELATDVDPHAGKDVSYGFLATSGAKELIVAIRGTDTILEWIHDASFLLMPSPITGLSGMTEDGFTAVFRSLRTQNQTETAVLLAVIQGLLASGAVTSVTVCGHSLGGALATLVAAQVALNSTLRSPTLYTFASPRVGDHLFAGSFNMAVPTSFRVVNRQDLVPKLPPILPFPYEHTNTLFELNTPYGSANSSVACMHHLTTYLWLIAQQAGTSGYPLDTACSPATASTTPAISASSAATAVAATKSPK